MSRDENSARRLAAKANLILVEAVLAGSESPNFVDPEPQPGDGPDYHAEHAAWVARNVPQRSGGKSA